MKKLFTMVLCFVLVLGIMPVMASAQAPENYNLSIDAELADNNQLVVTLHNGNNFTINDIALTIEYDGQTDQMQIGSIARNSD